MSLLKNCIVILLLFIAQLAFASDFTQSEENELQKAGVNLFDALEYKTADPSATVPQMIELAEAGVNLFGAAKYKTADPSTTVPQMIELKKAGVDFSFATKYKTADPSATVPQMIELAKARVNLFDAAEYKTADPSATVPQMIELAKAGVNLFGAAKYKTADPSATVPQMIELAKAGVEFSAAATCKIAYPSATVPQMIELAEAGVNLFAVAEYKKRYPSATVPQMISNFKFKNAVSNGDEITVTKMIQEQKQKGLFPSIIYDKDGSGITPLDIVLRQERKAKTDLEKNKYSSIKNLILGNQGTALEKIKGIITNGNKSLIIQTLKNLTNTDLLALLSDEEKNILLSKINPKDFHCFLASGAKIEIISIYDKDYSGAGDFLIDIAYDLGKKIVPVGNGYCFVFDSWKDIERHMRYLRENKKIKTNDKLILGNASHTYVSQCQLNNSNEKASKKEISDLLIEYAKEYKVATVLHGCFLGDIIFYLKDSDEMKNLCIIASSNSLAAGTSSNPMSILLKSKKGDNFFDIYRKSYKGAIISGLPFKTQAALGNILLQDVNFSAYENTCSKYGPQNVDELINNNDLYLDEQSKARRDACMNFYIP